MKTQIKRAVISKGGKDDTNRPVQQIEYMGKTSETEIVFPYGVHANLPPDSLLVLFPILDTDSSTVAIGGLPNERIQVEEGEVVFFHPLTKAKIHFRSNGDIDIDALDKKVNVNCDEAVVTAATKVTIDSPECQLTGNVQIDGDLTVDGATALSSTVTSNGVDISDTHTHQGSPTAPSGPITPTGVPV